MNRYIIYLLIISFLGLSACDEGDEPDPVDTIYPVSLVIVEDGIYSGIKSKLNTYLNDVKIGDSTALIIRWNTGGVDALRDSIKKYYDSYHITNVFLVGDLPVAWYEMEAAVNFDDYEEFPSDLYLMDPHATFTDADANGKFDHHSGLDLKVGVGRIIGTETEIKEYFDRNHLYRTGGSLTSPTAYLFIDDDWNDWYSNNFNIGNIYSQIDICLSLNETTRQAYIDKLKNGGAEYVHQMIHSYPSSLAIYHQGTSEHVSTSDIRANNFKASFFNMFNCSGARFTEESLGMTNVLGTDFGLAIMGTTKTGGNYDPGYFNQALANNYSWGEAFIYWYNSKSGIIAEKWTMGLCLLGDPMLRISPTTQKIMSAMVLPEITPERLIELEEYGKKMQTENCNKTFAEYKNAHPQYYR
ncbi:MAG: hypothetical protein ABIJ16_13735 [Bacteroidota bacterium]